MLILVTRSMTKILLDLSQSASRTPITNEVFQCFVKIEFCAKAEAAVFLKRTPRKIQRRMSISDAAASVFTAPTPQIATPEPRKQRSKSVEAAGHRYVAPAQLSSIIDGLKQSLG